jgi:dipeptidyl-peptidase-4
MMRRTSVLVLAVLALAAQESLGQSQAGRPWSWTAQGLLRDGEGQLRRLPDLEIDPGPSVPATAPEKASPLRDEMAAALRELGHAVPASAFAGRPSMSTLPRSPEPAPGLKVSADREAGILLHDGKLFWHRRGGAARIVLEEAGALRHLKISPDGLVASYIRGCDLFLLDLESGQEKALSSDGGEEMFVGELDWVYQEEVYGRFDFNANWWSPQSRHLAFLRIDESRVAEFVITNPIPPRQEVERLRYPKAGDGNPVATLHVALAPEGKVISVDLGAYRPEEEILIVRVGFHPTNGKVVFQVQDREQRWLDLNEADPDTGTARTLIRETSRSWVNILGMPRWLADGTFLWESERTGYRHIYHYHADGTLIRAITGGEWQVKGIEDVREDRGEIIFSATADGAIDTNFYRVALDGTGFRRLTQGPGTHTLAWNPERTHYIDTVKSVLEPERQWLCSAEGTVLREIGIVGEAPPPDEGSTTELVTIPARDGYPLDALLVIPSQTEPGRRLPIFINTYSGPDAPTVSNSPGADGAGRRMAARGIIGLSVNVKSASGRGQAHTDACYMQFGVRELQDLEDSVDWVVANRNGDPTRVGIAGFSYGGFMAAFALTHSRKFSLGIAGGGVFDWRLYDTIYTERYMRTPQNNADGYAKSSCVEAARDLHGHLLLVHGGMDDNVHVQNLLQLADALQRANKPFEMMIYPRARHGIGLRHYQDLVNRAISERL